MEKLEKLYIISPIFFYLYHAEKALAMGQQRSVLKI
jgi:hypothetical protein